MLPGQLPGSDYYPFGLAFNSYQSGLKNDYLYNGKELQDELDLGLYDYHARQYDPVLGRFVSIDPMADFAPGWTPYRYGFNNPMMYTDPTGMFEYSDGYSTKDSKYETGSVSHEGSFTGNAGDLEKGSTAGTTVTAMVELGKGDAGANSTSAELKGTSTGQGEVKQTPSAEDFYDALDGLILNDGTKVNRAQLELTFMTEEELKKIYPKVTYGNANYLGKTDDGKHKINFDKDQKIYELNRDNIRALGIHEIYGHGVMKWNLDRQNHYMAYFAVIDNKRYWDKTTPAFRRNHAYKVFASC